MTTRRSRAATDTYHHGNLRQALLDHAVELARTGGPDAVVLRDVQRMAGVSNSAAYRHYADRRRSAGRGDRIRRCVPAGRRDGRPR